MKVITANRLLDGDVVWLGENRLWVEQVQDARILESAEDVSVGLSIGEQAVKNQHVVGVYELDVTVDESGIAPVRLREKIRADGPTTHPDFGKLAKRQTAQAV